MSSSESDLDSFRPLTPTCVTEDNPFKGHVTVEVFKFKPPRSEMQRLYNARMKTRLKKWPRIRLRRCFYKVIPNEEGKFVLSRRSARYVILITEISDHDFVVQTAIEAKDEIDNRLELELTKHRKEQLRQKEIKRQKRSLMKRGDFHKCSRKKKDPAECSNFRYCGEVTCWGQQIVSTHILGFEGWETKVTSNDKHEMFLAAFRQIELERGDTYQDPVPFRVYTPDCFTRLIKAFNDAMAADYVTMRMLFTFTDNSRGKFNRKPDEEYSELDSSSEDEW